MSLPSVASGGSLNTMGDTLRVIPFSEVASHATADDCWLIIDNLVYDLSAFAPDHPGGAALVTDQGGRDATAPFLDAHSTDVIALTLGGAAGVAKALVGRVDAATVPAAIRSRLGGSLASAAAVGAAAVQRPRRVATRRRRRVAARRIVLTRDCVPGYEFE